MNSGPLPPVPDLIPISALRKNNNGSCSNNNRSRDCAPSSSSSAHSGDEVMGEQRSRRTGKQPAIDLIDTVQSRGSSAAPQAPSRKARSERHRKSDRRRDYKGGRRRSRSKQRSRSRASSPETPANPRVNPIFVWVRQENTRIVDVKCEDYDRRNRILLTKTAQGWRAIPRTETWAPSLKEAADRHHSRIRKSRKNKVKRKSAAVQVDDSFGTEDDNATKTNDLSVWTTPVNIESHLPSHKIQVVPKERSLSPEPLAEKSDASVNSDVDYSAQTQDVKCNASKICDISPLDNLLAVAELEFNHQIQTGEWNKTIDQVMPENADDSDHTKQCEDDVSDDHRKEYFDNAEEIKQYEEDDINDEQKEYLDNFEQLNKLIESCSQNDNGSNQKHFAVQKSEDCDYNEEDDNNLAMDDILNRLEQSLQSPENCKDINEILDECENSLQDKLENITETSDACNLNNNNFNEVPELDAYLDNKTDMVDDKDEVVELSSSINQDAPTDLSLKSTSYVTNVCDNLEPTDLSIPKSRKTLSRPASQNSETIQSPQPSGIPAVPHSPELVTCSKSKTTLDSLLMTRDKIALNSEVTITRQKEPLDLGKCRKSASPTVTCSEEAKNDVCCSEIEPPTKKFKFDETKADSLNIQPVKTVEKKKSEVQSILETPKLLELLTSDSEPDPFAQLKQVLADPVLNVPDPMLIPKDKLSAILSSPSKEIPKLLKQRPELRLPEALAFPHLLQDPNILVITLAQLQTIIQKQSQPLPIKDLSEEGPTRGNVTDKIDERNGRSKHTTKMNPTNEESNKYLGQSKEHQNKNSGINELANDIDAANTAFNQMMWLPYLNQLEAAMSFNNNAEFLKMLSNAFPLYPGQMPPDMPPHLFGNARIPPPPVNLPVQPQNYNNPLEFSMWQEAVMQANLLRSKNAYEAYNTKNTYRDFTEKSNPRKMNHHNMKHNQSVRPNTFYPSNINPYQVTNPFMNIPNNYQAPPTSSKHNLHIPQYNPILGQKSMNKTTMQKMSNQSSLSPRSANVLNTHFQRLDERKQAQQTRLEQSNSQKPKVTCKSFANVSYQRNEEAAKNFCSDYPRPIDLSDSNIANKYKMRQHYMDSVNKFFKPDEVPEVGSTTASIEEMQDAQKHLWHPLFGNQKNYNNQWNWSSATTAGE